MKIKNKILILINGVLIFTESIKAQTTTTPAQAFSSDYYDAVALAFLLVIVLILFGFLYFGMGEGKEEPVKERKLSLLSRLRQKATRAVPIEKEDEIMLADDYDGIKELDNRIPPWFAWLFYVTIIFAAFYLLDYHVFKTGKLQEQEYADEMMLATQQREELAKSGALIDENNITVLNDANALNEGKTIFKSNCVPCHGPDAGGVVGPNLTDDYWINGGGIKNIFRTIKNGVPAKGMLSWQNQLNPRQIQQVASYIISLHGSNPPNGKAPQGTRYAEASDSTSSIKM